MSGILGNVYDPIAPGFPYVAVIMTPEELLWHALVPSRAAGEQLIQQTLTEVVNSISDAG